MVYARSFLPVAALVLLLGVSAQGVDLISLIEKGDVAAAEEYMTKQELSAAEPVNGQLPLSAALAANDLEMIDLCLRYSASATVVDPKTKKSALETALGGKNVQVARMLLAYGADPDAESEDGSGKTARPAAKSVEMKALLDLYDTEGAEAFEDPAGTWERELHSDHAVVYYYNAKTQKSQYQTPPSCAWFRSKVDGHVIYVNHVTQQSKWVRPKALSWKRLHDKETGDAYWYNYALDLATSGVPAELPSEMASDMLYETGTYWHNKVTGESTWNDPAEKNWREVLDEEGRKFWYHPLTLESSWERPADLSWRQVASQDHDGQYYWVNDATGDAQWDKPAPLAWESGVH